MTWYCTPGDLEDLAQGWLIGEGFVGRDETPVALSVADDGRTIAVEGELTGRTSAPSEVPSLEAISPEAALTLTVDGNLRHLFERMFGLATLRRATGGIHTGALVVDGDVCSVREDVSRHCVIDKLIGNCRRTGIAPVGAMILLSGRVSATIAAKVARAGIPVVATMSIPTTLAATIAGRAGVTLIGRARGPNPHIYAPGA